MSSLADEPQLAQVHAAIAEGYASDDARRRELLDWLDTHGFGSTPFRSIPTDVLARARRELGHPASGAPAPPVVKTFTPAPPAPVQTSAPPVVEGPLSYPPRRQNMSCGNCGSKDHNRRTCDSPTKKPSAKAPEAKPTDPPRRPKAKGPTKDLGLEDCSLEELLELQVGIRAEVKRRKAVLEAEIARLAEAEAA